jgi:integrase/recombinase XerD
MKEHKISEKLAEFLDYCDVKQSSRNTYKRVMLIFIKYMSINKTGIFQASRADIIKYKAELSGKYEQKTVNLYITVIKLFYSFLAREGYYADVARGVKMVKVPHTYRRWPLSSDQVVTLLSAMDVSKANGKRDQVLINLMVKTGLRRVEVLRLNIEDIEKINGTPVLKIQRKGQTNKSDIKVISNQIYEDLVQLISERDGANYTDPLFISYAPGQHNKRLSIDSISRIVKFYLKKIGLTNDLFSCHSLRHTAAVTLLDLGYDMHYVQMFMGHSSPATTQLYTKVISDRINFDGKGINSLENEYKTKGNDAKH